MPMASPYCARCPCSGGIPAEVTLPFSFKAVLKAESLAMVHNLKPWEYSWSRFFLIARPAVRSWFIYHVANRHDPLLSHCPSTSSRSMQRRNNRFADEQHLIAFVSSAATIRPKIKPQVDHQNIGQARK